MKKKTRLFALFLALVATIPIAVLPVSASSATPPPGLLESQVGMEIRDGYPKKDVTVQWRNPNGDNVTYTYTRPCFLLNNLLDGIDNRRHYGVCCQSEAAAGVSKEKFSINLDAMKEDRKGWYLMEYETRRDIKWIFKVFYYGTKQSTLEHFEEKWNISADYQFLVAVSFAYRCEGKANKITHDSSTLGYNLKYLDATNYLIDLAAEDADKIGSRIQVGSGIAWLDVGGDHYAVMCVYNPQDKSSKSQRMIVFTPDTWAEKGSITVTKRSGNGELLAGATFRVKGITNTAYVRDITTDAQGVATTGIESLDLGKYTVTETKMPNGCRAVTEAEAKAMGGYLNGSGQLCFDVEVSAQKNTLNIKVNAINNKISGVGLYKTGVNTVGLSGAKFGLFDNPEASGEPLCTTVSDAGKVFFESETANLVIGTTYYIKELEPPAGYYILRDTVYEITYAGTDSYWRDGKESVINYAYGIPTGIDTNVVLYAVLLSITTVTFIGAAVLVHRKEKANKVC